MIQADIFINLARLTDCLQFVENLERWCNEFLVSEGDTHQDSQNKI